MVSMSCKTASPFAIIANILTGAEELVAEYRVHLANDLLAAGLDELDPQVGPFPPSAIDPPTIPPL